MEVDATSFPFFRLSPSLLFLRLVYLFVQYLCTTDTILELDLILLNSDSDTYN
jgi:hypothetical protein